MWHLLISLNKRLALAIPAMLAAGFLCGILLPQQVTAQLKGLVVPFTFLMVFPMMVTLNINHLLQGLANVRLQIAAQVMNFACIPLVAYLLGQLFFADRPYMALGLLLAGLLPTSGMTISWTGFARGNMGAAINMTVIGLTVGALAVPVYVLALLGTKVEVSIAAIAGQILIIVFLPMLLGFFTRKALLAKYSLNEFKQKIAPRFPATSTLGVLGVVFVAMALKAQTIAARPMLLLAIILPLILLYAINFVVSTLVGRALFVREDAIAFVFGTVMRNLSIALAIAMTAFGEDGSDAALVIAAAYIIQVQAAAWYVKLTDKIFGIQTDNP